MIEIRVNGVLWAEVSLAKHRNRIVTAMQSYGPNGNTPKRSTARRLDGVDLDGSEASPQEGTNQKTVWKEKN